MLTFDTTLYLIFALGLAAAALAIWLLITRVRLAGGLALVGAIALLALSGLLWHNGGFFAPSDGALAQAQSSIETQSNTIATLEDRLRTADSELKALRLTRNAPASDTSALDRELSAVRSSLLDSEKKLAAALERAKLLDNRSKEDQKRIARLDEKLRQNVRQLDNEATERERLIRQMAHRLDLILERARIARRDIGNPLRLADMPSGQSEWANEKRLDLIENEVARLGTETRIETSAIPERDSARQLGELRDRLAYGVSTDDYEVEVYPDREMIGGQRGRYYVVDLKDAESGVKFGFDAGQYTLDRSDRKFRKALSSFMRDVVDKLDGNATYRLMVRGSADRAAYRGRQKSNYRYTEIAYLPKINDGRYVNDQKRLRVDQRITNSDLPFLRARYLKDLVHDVYPTKEPVILEGNVTSKIDRKDRNAELMLFVDW